MLDNRGQAPPQESSVADLLELLGRIGDTRREETHLSHDLQVDT